MRAEQIIGDVRGRCPIVIDDMISTGGTIEAAVNALLAAGCREDILVATTHGLLVGLAGTRLSNLPIKRLLMTDSVAPRADVTIPVQTVSLAPLLARAIEGLHQGLSLDDLLAHR